MLTARKDEMAAHVTQIAIHEDELGMRNLYATAARTEVEAETMASVDASNQNRDPSGSGWTGIHVIKHPKTTFADAGLRLSATTDVIEPLMQRVRNFFSGLPHAPDDPYALRETDAYCFGFDETCFIKLEVVDDLVEYGWYEARTENAVHLSALRKSLCAIDALSPALIADYWLHATGAVADTAFLDAYFNALSTP